MPKNRMPKNHQAAAAGGGEESAEGRVAAMYADRCLVWSEGEEVVCAMRGRLKGRLTPVVGDRVRIVRNPDGGGTVTVIEPRTRVLIRRQANRKRISRASEAQVLAANVDMERLLREIPASGFPALELLAARDGLRAEALGRPFTAWAQDILTLAKGGLERLDATDAKGENEAKLLAPLEEIAASGKTLADRLLDLWEGEWNRRIEPIFESPLTLH